MDEKNDQPVPPALRMMAMVTGFQVSQALYVVAELGVATALADGPLPCAELAERVGCDPDALRRIIRFLASAGVFQVDGDSVRATPLGLTLADGAPGSMRDIARYFMQTHYLPFTDLLHTARTGENAAQHHLGMPFFDWVNKSPHLVELQNRAMAAGAGGRDEAFFAGYRLPPGDVVVDVGGADGSVLGHLLAHEPDRRGVVLDLPDVIAAARDEHAASAVADRVDLVAGDFFDEVPAGDVYFLSVVLHNWDDDSAGRILATIAAAAPGGARVVLLETVLPEGEIPVFEAILDLTMLAVLNGRERTACEWQVLLERNGFALDRIVETATPFSFVEATLAAR
ncbi:methyltransferase [Lentzea sp. NPDC059081]|uniref:methyltransferase n=1 Tax=Lentzea sp. NPDC059081 TaxID=3346719 RepID=UPI003688FE26